MHTELTVAIIVVVALILLTWWAVSMSSSPTDGGTRSISGTRATPEEAAIQTKATAFHNHEKYWSEWLYGIRTYIIGKSAGYAGTTEEADRVQLLIKRIGICLSKILGKKALEDEFLELLLDYQQKLLLCIDQIVTQANYEAEAAELNSVSESVASYISANSTGKVDFLSQLNAWKARNGSVFSLAETLIKGDYHEGSRSLDVVAEGSMIAHKHLVKALW